MDLLPQSTECERSVQCSQDTAISTMFNERREHSASPSPSLPTDELRDLMSAQREAAAVTAQLLKEQSQRFEDQQRMCWNTHEYRTHPSILTQLAVRKQFPVMFLPAEVHFPSGNERHIASYGIWYDRLVVDATHILATCTEADTAGEKTRQRISRLPGGKAELDRIWWFQRPDRYWALIMAINLMDEASKEEHTEEIRSIFFRALIARSVITGQDVVDLHLGRPITVGQSPADRQLMKGRTPLLGPPSSAKTHKNKNKRGSK
eukprot:PhM_4_TR18847/c2_g1_i1/m.100402